MKGIGKMNQIAGARYLVTGGAGFIGSHIVDQLLARAHPKFALSIISCAARWPTWRTAVASGRVKVIEGRYPRRGPR